MSGVAIRCGQGLTDEYGNQSGQVKNEAPPRAYSLFFFFTIVFILNFTTFVLQHCRTTFEHLKTHTMPKLTSLDEAKNQIIGERGSERREQYEKEIRLAKTKNLFNWGEISRLFSGTRSVIRKNSIPKVHEPIINEIVDATDNILKKHGIIK